MIQKQCEAAAKIDQVESLSDLAIAMNEQDKAGAKVALRSRIQELEDARLAAKWAELARQANPGNPDDAISLIPGTQLPRIY